MGVRAVKKKFDVMELVAVMVATTKKQQLGARTFSGGHFRATRKTGRKREIIQIYL